MSVDPTVDALLAHVEAIPVNPETPEAEPEAEPTPAPKILGKYDNPEEAQKGLHNLIQKMGAETEARVRAETRTAQLEAQLAAATRTDPLAEIGDEPITKELLVKVIQSEAAKIADEKMRPVVTAISSAMDVGTAEQAMLNEFGNDYYTDLPKLRAFLNESPKVQELVTSAERNGQPLLARQYAYAEFKRDQDRKADTKLQERGKERQEQNEEAKRDMAILGTDRKNVGQATVGQKPRMSREEAAALVGQVRRGDFREFDKQFSVKGIPSEEELRKISGWF